MSNKTATQKQLASSTSYRGSREHRWTIAAMYRPPFARLTRDEINELHDAHCFVCTGHDSTCKGCASCKPSIAWERDEAARCEVGTIGCALAHSVVGPRCCETW